MALTRVAVGLVPDAVFRALRTTPEGLSQAEAEARRAKSGANRLSTAVVASLPRQLLGHVVHFFALMLWGAAALAYVGGMPALAVAIVVVILVNASFSFVQEYRADRTLRALSALVPATSLVTRDGRQQTIAAADLVVGDVMLLREGDRVCADAQLVRSSDLRVDLSTLTGESEPVERDTTASAEVPRDPLDAPNLVLAGSFVASGSATAIVTATGSATRLGGISRATAAVARRPTPLRLQLDRVVRVISGIAVATGVGFFGVSLGFGMAAGDGFLFMVGVIVALVPEGLLPTLSLSLAMSATRMARRGALVRRLESVETLGATTVICTDKTGTITANEMTARVVVLGNDRFLVTGSGFHPAGTLVTESGRPISDEEQARLRPLLHAAALCGNARVVERDGRWRCAGDPTEGALLVLATKGGIDRAVEERRTPRVRELPFDSRRRRMSTVHALPTGEHEVLVKGSPEAVLPLCVLADATRADALRAVDALAADGLRVLALARVAVAHLPATAGEAERGEMELLGLVGVADPIRPEVPDAIARCLRAGIRVLMITGDHPATARSVARQAGLRADGVMIGSDLPEREDELAELLATRDLVLARVAPEQKLRVARALQSRGDVVAMTGDGVNDAPALRQADIGIAMGRTGTDVAREAADLVLLDDNFAHIVEAIVEGRAAFDNIKRFMTYHLTDNVAELAPFVIWALSGGEIPLMITVLQILALDIGTDLLPALALGGEEPESGVMDRRPRPRNARLLDRGVLGRAFGFLGPIEAIASMAMLPLGAAVFFGWPGEPLPAEGASHATLSTMVFAAIVLMQMANALECRSSRASLIALGPLSNRLLAGAVIVELLALAGFVYWPPVRHALGHEPIGPFHWLLIGGTPLVLLAAEEARKAVARRRRRCARRTLPELTALGSSSCR
jgi:magnesium-transporting ATPase (P-type)